MEDKQIALKPYDLVVLLKLVIASNKSSTYAELAEQLKLSASQIHASVKRSRDARLIGGSSDERPVPLRGALREFIIYGAKYAFPPILGAASRGMLTAHAAPPLDSMIVSTNELPPVWPDPLGEVRGLAFYPLYPKAIEAAKADRVLYELLALFDALRGGAGREKDLAAQILQERLA